MVGAFAAIYGCEKSSSVPGIYSTYCARPARACQGKDDRSTPRPTVSLFGGGPTIGTYPGSYYAIPYCSSSLTNVYLTRKDERVTPNTTL